MKFNLISDQGYNNQYQNDVTFHTKPTVKNLADKKVQKRMWNSGWNNKLV